MLLGNGFALYSFNHHRYMYKRLTFALFAFVGRSVLRVGLLVLEAECFCFSYVRPGGDRSTHKLGE